MTRFLLLVLVVLAGVAATASAQTTAPAPPPAGTFRNPLKLAGADPWMTHFDGWYYLTTTTSKDVRMRRSLTLGGLRQAKDQVVWACQEPEAVEHVWAAEFHRMKAADGTFRWYGYYTASPKATPGQRMYAIESDGDSPLGPYRFKGLMNTDAGNKHFAIDGTPVFGRNGRMVFIWAGQPAKTGIGLYVDAMKDPWTLHGERRPLPAEGFGFDHVREGPVALYHGEKIFLVYSLCGAPDPNYRLSMLVADANADLADPASWKQHPAVVFQRDDAARVYGPGHNFFFKSPDGKEDWIVYHAKTTTKDTYADRTCRAQPFTWDANGLPVFGKPLATEIMIKEPSGTPAGK